MSGALTVAGVVSAPTAGFAASLAANWVVGSGGEEITGWDTATYGYNVNDFGAAAFDTSTGRFTAPTTGYYSCWVNIRLSTCDSTGYNRMQLRKNGVEGSFPYRVLMGDPSTDLTDEFAVAFSGIMCAASGDYISYWNDVSTCSSISTDDTGFGCHLVAAASAC